MKHSLYVKFILGYLIFGLLAFILLSTVSSQMTYNYLLDLKAEELYNEASLLASNFSGIYRGQSLDLASARPQLDTVATYLQSEAWIVNNRGTIITSSNDAMKAGTIIQGFDPTFTGNKSYYIGKYFGIFHDDVLTVSSPITGNYQTYGYVLLHLPISKLIEMRDGIVNILFITAGIIFGLSLIILLVFTFTVYFPLKKITLAANQYAEGNLKYKVKLNTQDEIGYLGDTLNYMSDELNKAEEYQRNFIANVSHDFRSPLTSIKGYLEAILDGTIPPEMQEKYLTRVISETDRLNKLTQGLLTLNSLDSKGYLSRSNFDINRVIKDTAASFEGTCNSKDLVLDLTFSANTTMVYADLGKIQQVLYNLIDNAIKFSHQGSVIYIQTSIKFEKVFVSVKDTGIGIPKDNLKKIWERFYKTDQSRGKDKRGTGLGLAIVKEIIQNHGETIDVISTQDVGTEFIFTLPRSGS